MQRLVNRVDEDMKSEIVSLAAQFEHRLKTGSKPIIHLEGVSAILTPRLHAERDTAFVAKVMASWKVRALSSSSRTNSPCSQTYTLMGVMDFD